jgi:Leucine-rich repeat (LRR) protein
MRKLVSWVLNFLLLGTPLLIDALSSRKKIKALMNQQAFVKVKTDQNEVEILVKGLTLHLEIDAWEPCHVIGDAITETRIGNDRKEE